MNFLTLLLLLTFSVSSFAFDSRLIKNNKESISRMINDQDLIRMEHWLRIKNFNNDQLFSFYENHFLKVVEKFVKSDAFCDLRLTQNILEESYNYGIIETIDEAQNLYIFLRYNNLIDDLLYDLLKKTNQILFLFDRNKQNPASNKPINLNRRYSAITDLKKLYSNFSQWPNDLNSCTIQNYLAHINKLGLTNNSARNKDLKKLNWLALSQNIISLEAYNRLEVLRNSNITSWPITTARYFDIIKHAKDKKALIIEENTDDDFHSTYVLRKENLTRRGKLYAAYNSTQIFLMSQIIEKTAKRMDAKYVELTFQFTDDPNGEQEVYIFSPMEQYRISINMLKKEIAELVRSDSFKGAPLDYGDLIASAFETGLIKSEEINQVLKFEDFWNPKVPRWKAYANYAFSLVGTATYYLPPPWNLLGAIGLIMTQMKVNDDPKADPEDNWNTII